MADKQGLQFVEDKRREYDSEAETPGPYAPKAGDVVRLKSGGPAMTVVNINQEDVDCMWFATNESEEVQSETFHIKSIYPC